MCAKQPAGKINRKLKENPKITKLVLLETRIQALQLLLMKFGLKLNTLESILNLCKKGILYITLAYKLNFLRFLVGSIFKSCVSLCKSFKLSIVL
jgi:hypothetical protein